MTGAPSSSARFWPIVAHGKCVGHVVARGVAGFEAYDTSDTSLGIFETAAKAADALLKRVQP
jgi:hypothetical protein